MRIRFQNPDVDSFRRNGFFPETREVEIDLEGLSPEDLGALAVACLGDRASIGLRVKEPTLRGILDAVRALAASGGELPVPGPGGGPGDAEDLGGAGGRGGPERPPGETETLRGVPRPAGTLEALDVTLTIRHSDRSVTEYRYSVPTERPASADVEWRRTPAGTGSEEDGLHEDVPEVDDPEDQADPT